MANPVPILEWPTPDLRQLGLFMDTVPQLEWNLRYGAGVTFQPIDLTDLSLVATPDTWCAQESSPPAARACKAFETQTAFQVLDSFTATTLEFDEPEMREDVARRWPLLISEALAREFLLGTGGSNHNLTTDATALAATSTIIAGIAELEEAMAINLGNTLGMIHMAPSALVYAVTNGTVSYNGGRYYSPGGHLVVADAGYQPAGGETTTTTMYATGLVRWSLSPRESRMDTVTDGVTMSAFKNQLLWLEDAIGLIVFDPETVWSTAATRA